MVRIEVTKIVSCQASVITGKRENKMIMKINIAAPFEMTERKDVILTGEPS
jgi:hypothetical protein